MAHVVLWESQVLRGLANPTPTGTVRAYLANHILGVSEGHAAILRLVGVGYRATVEKTAVTKSPEYEGQEFVSLKVGYSHPSSWEFPRASKPAHRSRLASCSKALRRRS